MATTNPIEPPGGASPPGSVQHAPRPPVDLRSEDSSLGELIGQATSDLSDLFRSEIELAKVELKEEVQTAGKAGAMFGAAGVLGYTALLLFCFAAAWGLTEIVPQGVAFLIVALIVGAVAAVLALQGKKKLEDFTPVPTQTVETIQEDVQWAKQLKS